MEQIEIKGFLTIEHAVFEIKKINVLIGEQAQGKSVIAKLVYFCRDFFPNFIKFVEKSVDKSETKREFDKKILTQFEQIFPRYSWAAQEFSIQYQHEHYSISIERKKTGGKYTPLKLSYNKPFSDLHRKLKNAYQVALDDFDKKIESQKARNSQERRWIFNEVMSEKIKSIECGSIFRSPIFIPASRSFFANLQKNIFSFLASNIDIDPLIKEFGSRYEQSKRIHQSGVFPREKTESDARKSVGKLFGEVIVGEYVYSDEQDWIQHKGRKTNLANASSGQQESLPMLLILQIWPFVYGKERPATFFIEEPEAHLFPKAQKQIVSLISSIYKELGHNFFITTHSPYILTAINNLVVGQDAYDKVKDNPEKLAELEKVLPVSQLIRLEDVSAYTLKNGKLESIIDWENRLIGANLLDAVSVEFEQAFNVASDMLYEEE